MGIAVTFYNYTGDPRVANKTFTNGYNATILNPLREISNLEIEFDINYNTNVMNADYVAAEGKYYKITDRERLLAGGMRIKAKLDSVKTYWDQIKNCDATCGRNQTKYNSQFVDPKYMMLQNREIETFNIGKFAEFQDFKIIMCYNGSAPKTSGAGYTHTTDGHAFGGGGGSWW